MKTIQFRTNINCQGCLAKVKPALDELLGTENWNIDLLNENKVLSVRSSNGSPENIIKNIKEKGFTAEII